MRLLFAHDHRFRPGPNGEIYTPSSFPRSFWDRYLGSFEEVHVVSRGGAPVKEGENLARADRDEVSFEFLPNASSLRQLLLPSRPLNAQMAAAVRSADAVVARLPSEIGQLAVRHARRQGKPYAIEVVGCPWDGLTSYGTISARLYAPLAYLRHRRAIANAPMALYVTSSWLQERYPTKGEWTSASNVMLSPMPASGLARREARLAALAAGQKPVLGTIAKLSGNTKGLQTSLAALAQLRARGEDYVYRILGPGPVEGWKSLAESLGVIDLVRFDGTRSAGQGVGAWLDDIDIYLQPSFQEGLPRATIEAMSRGAACIGSTCGGIPELLPPERLHRPGDVAGLTDRIRELVRDPSGISATSQIDRRTSERFDPQFLAERRSEFYAHLRALAESYRTPASQTDASTRPG